LVYVAVFVLSLSLTDATYVYCENGEVCYEGTTCCYNQLTHENLCWLAPNAVCCPYGGCCSAGYYCTGRTYPDEDLCAPISSVTRLRSVANSTMRAPAALAGRARKL